jgi:hypothetical protein
MRNTAFVFPGAALALMILLGREASPAMATNTPAEVNWSAAVSSAKADLGMPLQDLRELDGFAEAARKLGPQTYREEAFGADLQTINVMISVLRPYVGSAGSPVLLPLDAKRLANDMAGSGTLLNKDKTASYFGGLKPLAFHPGPYGYRAYFQLKKTSTVMISGSSIFYQLPGNPKLPTLLSCLALREAARKAKGNEDEANEAFYEDLATSENGIELRKAGYFGVNEAAVPCTFAGALVEVHILCDSVGEPDCKVKDLARSIISRLTFVGGSPRPKTKPGINDPIKAQQVLVGKLESESEKRKDKVELPVYNKPGELLENSGEGGKGGSRDYNVYGPIIFPTDPSATAQTVIFRKGEYCLSKKEDKKDRCVHNGKVIYKAKVGDWRDNFCELRGANRLFTCPAGSGHAGQDIWGDGWVPGKYPLRAVTDGIAFRRFPRQPAVTISDVNATNIDYIYRHMRPSVLAKHGIGSPTPKKVKRGCVLALVDELQNLSGKKTSLTDGDGGVSYEATSPHLHFEIRVPTQSGYQHVSPYWTVTSAHKFTKTKVDTAPIAEGPCGPKV